MSQKAKHLLNLNYYKYACFYFAAVQNKILHTSMQQVMNGKEPNGQVCSTLLHSYYM